MTRFVFIADTHMGAGPTGFQQQQKHPTRLPAILDALRSWMFEDGRIDFLLHGGDMIEATSDDAIRAAVALFQFPMPVYLCLGNHDLTTPNALSRWMDLAPGFFPGTKPEFSIHTPDCIVQVAPNHWGDEPYHWKDSQMPNLTREQIDQVTGELQAHPSHPRILLTHSPVFAVPIEQTGMAEPFHPPDASFTRTFTDLGSKHDNLRCVLGAHNHVNSHVRSGGVDFITVSSLIETPFEFKLFEVTRDSVAMSTVSLAYALDFDGHYDDALSFVQGRPIDRSFTTLFRDPTRS